MEEAAWKKIKMDSQELINQNRRGIEIHELIVSHADKRMKEEADKFQKGLNN